MIWLIGNKGMLGQELAEAFERAKIDFVGTDREVSILDPAALASFATGKSISWIINCAAYTAVDKAEDEIELCTMLNVDGPRNIAKLAESICASMLHISTDYVFSGEGTRPYREDDPVGPTGVYGRTKADGEKAVLEACSRSVVVRTAWLYGKHGPNFVSTMLRLMRERDAIGVVADQKGSPTWARDLAMAIVSIVSSPAPVFGVFHFSNAGDISWYDFALAIKEEANACGLLDKDCQVKALTTDQYPTKAKRPGYSVLSKEKIKATYRAMIPDWRESLKAYIARNI